MVIHLINLTTTSQQGFFYSDIVYPIMCSCFTHHVLFNLQGTTTNIGFYYQKNIYSFCPLICWAHLSYLSFMIFRAQKILQVRKFMYCTLDNELQKRTWERPIWNQGIGKQWHQGTTLDLVKRRGVYVWAKIRKETCNPFLIND